MLVSGSLRQARIDVYRDKSNVGRVSNGNSKFGRPRTTSGGCGARGRRAGYRTPSGAPYPPYNGAGFVGWISAAHPPSVSLPTRCPPKFGTAGCQTHPHAKVTSGSSVAKAINAVLPGMIKASRPPSGACGRVRRVDGLYSSRLRAAAAVDSAPRGEQNQRTGSMQGRRALTSRNAMTQMNRVMTTRKPEVEALAGRHRVWALSTVPATGHRRVDKRSAVHQRRRGVRWTALALVHPTAGTMIKAGEGA